MVEIKEANAIYKDIRRVKLRICLIYPNEYRAGISNLGIHLLYFLFNSFEGVYCERYFFDARTPPCSIETGTPLKKFDVLAFSLQYELDFPRALRVLLDSGIPLKSSQRDFNDPIIIAGGPAVTQNPLPLSPFFDVFFIGEVEDLAEELITALQECREESRSKRRRYLKPLLDVPGVYIPLLKEQTVLRRVFVKNLDSAFYPTRQIMPLEDIEPVFGKAFLLEIGRGCGWGCRFCLSGFIYRPPRFRSFRKIAQILSSARSVNPRFEKVVTISLAATDHPDLVSIINLVVDSGFKVSIPSIRISNLTEDLAEALRKGGQRSLTLAPEVATEDLARRLNKKIYPEDVRESALKAFKSGFGKLKFYFILGLPYETKSDVQSIGKLLEDVLSIGFHLITVTVTPFIPKPHTPLQWVGQEDLKSILRKKRVLLKSVRHKERIRVQFLNPKHARIEAALARGDERLSEVIFEVAARGDFGLGSWHRAFRNLNIDIRDYANRTFSTEEELPWEIIDIGVNIEYLKREYERYKEGVESPSCYEECNDLCCLCKRC
ncbi:MAG: hypothetical protein DRJ51_01885 [Thermoprotei archaeon]|nr:MAG: hypothetical protein DRJ36_01740 [Thermoprotei archaeon]RLE82292.1 MAG: hypothetical protein DRJ51_01885 [Thermoprotei archaeon]RLF01770.1 MAG: hypothetical protein DRJ59_05320 [Thermoprotei archaeon]